MKKNAPACGMWFPLPDALGIRHPLEARSSRGKV
jgi:hypothetical protein